MKGYIYTMFKGADPSAGWEMTDPIYNKTPTMGACRPDIRNRVERGDYIFSISGRVIDVKPHIVGAFSVDDKINALAAFQRFPENRMQLDENGIYHGNVIVDANGKPLEFDYHKNQERRIENYIIGKDSIYFEEAEQIKKAKDETVSVLNDIFGKNEDKVHKIIGRCRKLDSSQVNDLLSWMNRIKAIH
ncbi:hypothetical protein [Mucilaginibacter sp. OK283]|jgi:hypothetical protein|uniref:hypothetical protein n=1 Tax=Mucilaginibacter sp. OK283 TaxID=1881049 RepID=UPI0008C8B54A|nr:hypothetical protein [Mucilaginibacter sp. OK283]SEO14105.1 hypothetical protein SAMN05428947_101458 [Mucilaginibacter sp. OK283]